MADLLTYAQKTFIRLVIDELGIVFDRNGENIYHLSKITGEQYATINYYMASVEKAGVIVPVNGCKIRRSVRRHYLYLANDKNVGPFVPTRRINGTPQLVTEYAQNPTHDCPLCGKKKHVKEFAVKGIHVNDAKLTVAWHDSRGVELTLKEMQVFRSLLAAYPNPVSVDLLIEMVYSENGIEDLKDCKKSLWSILSKIKSALKKANAPFAILALRSPLRYYIELLDEVKEPSTGREAHLSVSDDKYVEALEE